MNVSAQERPKISVRIGKNISGSGHRKFREGDSGRLEGRVWRDAVGAQNCRSADPFKRADRAKLLEGKNGPTGSNLVILMRQSDRVLGTVLELADRRDLVLAAELTGLRQRLIDAVAEIDSLALH
jgi:hypothetical protein